MAEAIINARLNEDWQTFSAGTQLTGCDHRKTEQALVEIGIQNVDRSKHLDECRQTSFTKVVSLCDAAAGECPLWIGACRRVHIGFLDPAKARGTEDAIMHAFRNVRDDIAIQIHLAQIHLALNNLN